MKKDASCAENADTKKMTRPIKCFKAVMDGKRDAHMIFRYREQAMKLSGGMEGTKNKDEKDAYWEATTGVMSSNKAVRELFPEMIASETEKDGIKWLDVFSPCHDPTSDTNPVFSKECPNIEKKYKDDNNL